MFTSQLGTLSSRPANIILGYFGVMTAIAVAPASASVVPSGTLQLAASAKDQLGYTLEVQPAMTWTVPSGNSTIGSSTGLFTADASPESATARATNGSVHGDSAITVADQVAPLAFGSVAQWRGKLGNGVLNRFRWRS